MLEAAKREEAGWTRAIAESTAAGAEATVPDAALGALLDDADATADGDAELWVKRLGERVGRLDALNVGGMLAAATEGGGAGARLSARLDAGGAAAAALSTRLSRLDALARAAPAALHARSGAARADAAARALLQELTEIYAWLDAPQFRDLDSISEISLASPEGRARALAAGTALRSALRAEKHMSAARRRLGAVRERVRRLQRAKDALAAALARHLNNLLIHLGNEAAMAPATASAPAAAAAARAHHADLLPYAPFMRWLKDMDEKAYDALTKVYVGTWARVYEREARAACDAARAAPAPPAAEGDTPLDNVLTVVENICNAEQDFCAQFFFLDVDVKSDGSDGERSETSEETGARRGAGVEARRMMADLFPALEAELVALVNHLEKQPYGAMRALACVGSRVLGDGATGGETRWARAALAAVAVAAKRGADRVVAERLAAMPDAARQAAKRPKAGLLGIRGAKLRMRSHLRPRRPARGPGALVRGAGRRHAGRHRRRRAPAHAAARAAARELSQAARAARGAACARAGRAAARGARALRGGAAAVRHAVLRPPARQTHAVLRGRCGGGGGRRAGGGGVLPRGLQQARAQAHPGHVSRAGGAALPTPAVPHRGKAAERRGRPTAGGVARHARRILGATSGITGSHCSMLPWRGAGAAAEHAGHPRRLLRHRARALTHAGGYHS